MLTLKTISELLEGYTDANDVEDAISNALLRDEPLLIPGFNLLSSRVQKEYIEKIINCHWYNSFNLVAAANSWASVFVERKDPLSEMEHEINSEITDAVANNILLKQTENHFNEETGAGTTLVYMHSLSFEDKMRITAKMSSWLRKNNLTNEVSPDLSLYDTDEELASINSELRDLALHQERVILARNISDFNIGTDTINKFLKGELDKPVDIENEIDTCALMMGIPEYEIEAFRLAYKVYIEEIKKVISNSPALEQVVQAFNDEDLVVTLQELIYDPEAIEYESVPLLEYKLSQILGDCYWTSDDEQDLVHSDLDDYLQPTITKLRQVYDDLSSKTIAGSDGFMLLDDVAKRKAFITYYKYCINPDHSDEELHEQLQEVMFACKVDTLNRSILTSINDSGEELTRDNLLSIIKSGPVEIMDTKVIDYFTKSLNESYSILYEEKDDERGRIVGFNLLSEREKKSWLIKHADAKRHGSDAENDILDEIQVSIHEKVKRILREHTVVRNAVTITPYDLLDKVDLFEDAEDVTDGFKQLTVKHFLTFYESKVGNGENVEEIIDAFHTTNNTVRETLDRTAFRFYAFALTSSCDDKIFNLIAKQARGDKITNEDYILSDDDSSQSRLAKKILEKAVAELNEKFDMPESRYLREALRRGATLEGLFKKDSETLRSSRERLESLIYSGFGTEMFTSEKSGTLSTVVNELLYKDRFMAAKYLENIAIKHLNEIWPKEQMFWLSQAQQKEMLDLYVDMVIVGGDKKLNDWKSLWQASILQNKKSSKGTLLVKFEKIIDLYELTDEEKEQWRMSAEKELLNNFKKNKPGVILHTRTALEKRAVLKHQAVNPSSRPLHDAETDLVEVAEMLIPLPRELSPAEKQSARSKIIKSSAEMLAEKEKEFRELGIVGDDVVLSRLGIIQRQAKMSTAKMSLEHYYDVMFQMALGIHQLSKAGAFEDDGKMNVVPSLLAALNISEDEFEVLATALDAYTNKRDLFINFKPVLSLDSVGDNVVLREIKNKIFKLENSNITDRHNASSANSSERKKLNKNISEKEAEIVQLYLEMQYETQRKFFTRTRDDFNKLVVNPAIVDVSNRNVTAFVSAVSQAFSATDSMDFAASAANVLDKFGGRWERRYDESGHEIGKSWINSTIDSVIVDEVPKLITSLYEEQCAEYTDRLRDSVDALRNLKKEDLQSPRVASGRIRDTTIDSTYQAACDGIMTAIETMLTDSLNEDEGFFSHIVTRASKSYVDQTKETAIKISQGLFHIRNSLNTEESQEISLLLQELQDYIFAINALQKMNPSDHDGTSVSVSDVDENVKRVKEEMLLADKILKLNGKLQDIANKSSDVNLKGITTVYNGVVDDLVDFKDKISITEYAYRELYERQSEAPRVRLVDEDLSASKTVAPGFINTALIKRDVIVKLQSSVADVGVKYKLSLNKKMLNGYVQNLRTSTNSATISNVQPKSRWSKTKSRNKNGFLRGIFTFFQQAFYFIKHGKLPNLAEIKDKDINRINDMFHKRYQEQQVKAKGSILLESARLLKTFQDPEDSPAQRYVYHVINYFDDEAKLYARSVSDESGEILKKYFPERAGSVDTVKPHVSSKYKVEAQKNMESSLKTLNPQKYELYVQELNKQIPKICSENQDIEEAFASLQLDAMKKKFKNYIGDDVTPKENKVLLVALRKLQSDRTALEGGAHRKDVEKIDEEIDSIVGKMSNYSMTEHMHAMKRAFEEDIYERNTGNALDTSIIHDQKMVARVAIKQLFEYDLSNDIINSAMHGMNRTLDNGAGFSAGREVSSAVQLYASQTDTSAYKTWAGDVTHGMVFDKLEQPMTYVKELAAAYECEAPEVKKIPDLDGVRDSISAKYIERLEELNVDGNSMGLKEASLNKGAEYYDIVVAKLQSLNSYCTSAVDAVVDTLEAGKSDPTAVNESKITILFSTIENSFSDQTMIVADSINSLLNVKEPGLWIESKRDIIEKINNRNNTLKDLEQNREQLAKIWRDESSGMSIAEKDELTDKINRIHILKGQIAKEISVDIQQLCYEAPTEKVDTEILEGLCLIRWADCYIDFYRNTLAQTKISVDELCQQRQAIEANTYIPSDLTELYNTGVTGVIKQLGNMVANKLNGEPLKQLNSYTTRMEASRLSSEDELIISAALRDEGGIAAEVLADEPRALIRGTSADVRVELDVTPFDSGITAAARPSDPRIKR
jgi:hypothetical protein